jgi:hypothetical protein
MKCKKILDLKKDFFFISFFNFIILFVDFFCLFKIFFFEILVMSFV